MPFLLPQLRQVEPSYDGTRPLPARLERIAQLVASDTLTLPVIAARSKVSRPSVVRLKAQPAFRSRVAVLRQRAAEQAQADAPLAYKGNRIAMLDAKARRLSADLERNDFEATIAVDKQGNPITGFDRGRMAELVKTVMAIDTLVEGKRSTIAEAQQLAVSVTMTTEQAVTKVQALLSRATDEGQAPGTPLPGGYGGVSTGADTIREDRAVLDTEYKVISDAKAE